MVKKRKIEGSIAFGIMDGIITLLGILLAMFAINADQHTIIVAAIATAIADSTANAAGYHASEEAANGAKGHSAAMRSSALCFVATFIAMIIPLVPIILLQPPSSIYLSAVIGLLMLFSLGKYVKDWKVGIEYLAIGVIAGVICYAVGIFVK